MRTEPHKGLFRGDFEQIHYNPQESRVKFFLKLETKAYILAQ